jgi:MerR family transcriptional regulator, redox-sensitive transcriptional activator SoxR
MSEDGMAPLQARLKSRGFSVGDLARLTGARPSAIRYYETCGLMPAPARRSGRRLYDKAAAERLQSIMAARSLGFSIAELRTLASADIQGWRAAAQSKAASIKAMADKLNANAEALNKLAACHCASRSDCSL